MGSTSFLGFSYPNLLLVFLNLLFFRNFVEGTTYNHGRPEGISERLAFYEPVSRYATGMSALRTQIYGFIPRGSSLPTSPDPAP